MGMTVQRRKDSYLPRVIMHKGFDIRGGVSVNVKELGGDYLNEGAVLTLMGSVAMEHKAFDRQLPKITCDKTLFPD